MFQLQRRSLASSDKQLPDFRSLFEALPGVYSILTPRFNIVDVSDDYLRAAKRKREDLLDRNVFEAFPDNPSDAASDGTSKLRASLEWVIRNRVGDTMALQKYDIALPEVEGGGFVERYWRIVNTPVLGADNQVKYIIHHPEDVTELVRLKRSEAEYGHPRVGESDDPVAIEMAVFVTAKRVQETNSLLKARNEQLATEGERELRALFDCMPQMGWSSGPDGARDFFNRQFYEYTGATYEELAGSGWHRIHDPALLPSIMQRLADSLRLGTPFEMEFLLRRRDGAFRWFHGRVNPIRDVHDVVVRWVGTNTDIDDQKRVAKAGEERRRITEAERDGFFDLTVDLLAISGFDGYFQRLNPAWEQTLGWPREKLLSNPWVDFVHPDDRAATLATLGKVIAGGRVVAYEDRYLCQDGSYRLLQWNAIPDMERGLVYAAARDITEARASREALRELSENLETTLLSIGDGVVATDVSGAVIRMNPAAERITGWRLAEAKRRPFAEIFNLVDEATRSTLENPVDQLIRKGSGGGVTERTIFVRRDKSEAPIATSCAPIRTLEGKVNGAVLVFRDLTKERDAAQVQAKYEQQLVFADRMASVGTLAAGVAHEINNPLTYISANIVSAIEEIRVLSAESPSSRIADLESVLLEAREGATRVAKIVRGLKTFSRIEDERIGAVKLVPVLELAIRLAFNEIRHRGRLVTNFGEVPLVDADDARLGQVFINLLVNAAQALPQKDLESNEIHVTTSTDASGRAVVEVRDTGPGIAPEILGRIFDPFFTTKPVGVGTGLGLAICHNIVTRIGGEISVRSDVGRGTTFRVVLPASSTGVAIVPRANAQPKTADGCRVKVLLVDDEPSVGLSVRRVLRNHDVTVVTTAQDALDLLTAGQTFDVILSDLMMPRMSGMEFFHRLSDVNSQQKSRVVFLTGGAFTAEATSFLEKVPNERMEKPFDLDELRCMVEKFAQ